MVTAIDFLSRNQDHRRYRDHLYATCLLAMILFLFIIAGCGGGGPSSIADPTIIDNEADPQVSETSETLLGISFSDEMAILCDAGQSIDLPATALAVFEISESPLTTPFHLTREVTITSWSIPSASGTVSKTDTGQWRLASNNEPHAYLVEAIFTSGAAEKRASKYLVVRALRRIDIAYEGYPDHGSPGDLLDTDEAILRLLEVAPYARALRFYGVSQGLAYVALQASRLGMKILITSWVPGPGVSVSDRDLLLELVPKLHSPDSPVEILVDNEPVSSNRRSVDQVVSYMNELETLLPGVSIGVAEGPEIFLLYPELAGSGHIWFQTHPWRSGGDALDDYNEFLSQLAALRARFPSARINCSETTRPTAGSANGTEFSSSEAALFLGHMMDLADGEKMTSVWMASHDCNWKMLVESEAAGTTGIMTNGTPGIVKPELLEKMMTFLGQ